VADPPRSGLPPGAARLLGRLAREKILYLSCNPSTLARDLREIAEDGEWRLSEVIPADMFPQTAEVESLAELVPVGGLQDRRSRISPSRRAS
jgi:23S rRNA (uracil1939-C5)-methyltransferase